jgi:tetratricopeptide (TPR) repeat protein
MRLVVAVAAALLLAGAAQAQTAVLCAAAQSQWDHAAASGKGADMLRVASHIPSDCPAVRRQADAKIAALQAQYAQQQRRLAEQRAQQQRQAAANSAGATGAQTNGDNAPFELAAGPPPAAPLDPCSVEGVQRQYPQAPVLGQDDPTQSTRSRADLANLYVERGLAFERCHLDSQALGDFRDAATRNPRSFQALDAEGALLLKGKDYEAAIDAYSRAIDVAKFASPDENVLTAYAGRAAAEAALQQYPEVIRDLQVVTDKYRPDTMSCWARRFTAPMPTMRPRRRSSMSTRRIATGKICGSWAAGWCWRGTGPAPSTP